MTSQPEREFPVPERKFQITPKTTNESLKSQYSRNGTNSQFRSTVAEDMITNAKELDNRIDWREVLGLMSTPRFGVVNSQLRSTGKSVLEQQITPTVGSATVKMGWNMDSPAVVYMGGYYFLRWLDNRLDILNEKIENADIRIFEKDRKDKQLAQERAEAEKLTDFKNKLNESLNAFITQNFPHIPPENLETYLRILGFFLFPSESYKQNSTHKKTIACNLLRTGNIVGAAESLGILPPRANQ